MLLVYILSVVVAARGLAAAPTDSGKVELPAPDMKGIMANDNSLKVMWNKVISPQSSDPVLGYLVQVWKRVGDTDYTIKMLDSKDIVDQKEREWNMYSILPETPTEIKVEGADTTEVVIKDFNHKFQYHIRVQAYTKNERGPLSAPVGIKFLE